MDISEIPEVLSMINAILSHHGIAEVKCEEWRDGPHILVVEQNRTVKVVYPDKVK